MVNRNIINSPTYQIYGALGSEYPEYLDIIGNYEDNDKYNVSIDFFNSILLSFGEIISGIYQQSHILKQTFYRNIIFIVLIIILMIGLLVYIQMRNGNIDKALNIDQPTEVVKEVEVKNVLVEQKKGFEGFISNNNNSSYERESYGKYGNYGKYMLPTW